MMAKQFVIMCCLAMGIIVASMVAAGNYLMLKMPVLAQVSSNYQGWQQVVCTQDVMKCPDGSYVSRQAPECNFAACSLGKGTVNGKVTVGPICPVEQAGKPCTVPPEAYTSREVFLYDWEGTTVIQKMHFMADGTYSFQVKPGAYIVDVPKTAIGGAKGVPQMISVTSGETVTVNFSIDTGIR